MKKIIGLVVILAALVLGSYYGMGLITERTIEKNVEVINQSNGLYVDIPQYNRGWFTSSAVLNWRLHVPEHLTKDQNGQSITVPAQDYTLQMPLTIYHGPIIFSDNGVKFGLGYAHSDIAMPPAFDEKFANLFTGESTKPKLSLNLFVNYLNNSQLHLDVPAFKLIAKQGGNQFEWDGMDSHISVSSSLRNIDGGLTIDGASLSKNTTKATLAKVSSSYNLHQTDEGLYLGEASLSLPSFLITENGQPVFDLEQFDMNSSSDIQDGLFNTSFKASLKKVVAQGKTYGPAALEMSLKNLDAQVLAEINTQANAMQQGTDAQRQQALIAILPNLPKLFSKGAQFGITKLSFVVPEGMIEGDLLVSLPAGDVGNPFQLVQKVQGHGKLKMPATVVKSVLVTSIKQKLQSQQQQQPSLQQAMVQQMKSNEKAEPQTTTPAQPQTTTQDQAATSTTQDNQPAPAPTTATSDQTKPLSAEEINQQAVTEADQKLSAMTQVGLLTLQDNEYVIEVNLEQGQLTVNGKPFTQEMVQF